MSRQLIIWLMNSLFLCLLFGLTPVAADAVNAKENVLSGEQSKPYSFVVWGHPRGKIDGDPPLHLEEILKKIRDLKVDALFVTGDIVNGGSSANKPYDPELVRGDWARFKKVTGDLGIPVYISPGNHDVNNMETRDMFLEFNRAPPFAVSHNNIRFIVLDSVGLKYRKKHGPVCPIRRKEFWPIVDGQPRESHINCWDILGSEFDSEQIEFVRNELEQQVSADHIFLFMHHAHPWAREDGWWWESIHPLLKASKTRAVFSGDPYMRKFGYLVQDNINYLQSASFQGVPSNYFANHRDRKYIWPLYHELDNILHVVVNGTGAEGLEIQPLVVGALDSEVGDWRYWREVPKTYTWSQNMPELFYHEFYRFRSLLVLFVIYAAVFFLLGVSSMWLWRRFKSQ